MLKKKKAEHRQQHQYEDRTSGLSRCLVSPRGRCYHHLRCPLLQQREDVSATNVVTAVSQGLREPKNGSCCRHLWLAEAGRMNM